MSILRLKQSFEAMRRSEEAVAATRQLTDRAKERLRKSAAALEAARKLMRGAAAFERAG